MVSRRLRDAVRCSNIAQYKLALMHNGDPSWLSKALNNAIRVRRGDARIVAIAKAVGLDPTLAFEPEEERRAAG